MKVCSNCGSESPEGARVCANCAAVLPEAAAPASEPGPHQSPAAGAAQGSITQPQVQQVMFPGPQVIVQTTDGQAVGALVCGILGLFFCPIVLSIVAIVLARQSSKSIKASGGKLEGEGMATAGLVMGIVGLVLWGLLLVFFVLVFVGVFAGFVGTY